MIEKICRRVCGILHISVSDKAMGSLVQFIKFGLIGVSNTAISYGLNVLVLFLMKPYDLWWDYIVGNMVAFTGTAALCSHWVRENSEVI